MEDKCLFCGDVIPEGRQICPICNHEYSERPALSRKDGATLICPRCGTEEALESAKEVLSEGLDDEQWEAFKRQVLESLK